MLTIPEQHQKKIALSTLKMNSQMASIAGGMNLQEAYLFLLNTVGWSDFKIQSILRKNGHTHFEIQDLMKKIHIGGNP